MMRNVLFSVLLAAMAVAGASAAKCDQATSPTFVETKGNEDYPFIFEHVEILSHDTDSVSFSVSQNWVKNGTPMFAVQYKNELDQVCDTQEAVGFGSSKTYTAQCSEGHAEVGIFFYVGDDEEFSAQNVEGCSAPDTNYVGHYVTIPCNYDADCYEIPIVQSERSLAESCTCEPGDSVKSWKCGNDVFFCQGMTQICENTGAGSDGSKYYELTDEQCADMKMRAIGDKCVTLPQYKINDDSGLGLSHFVCYDGDNFPMKNDGRCATCSGFKEVVAEPTKAPCPTKKPVSTPTDAPTTSPSESPTASPTESPTEDPSASPSDSPSASPTEPVNKVIDPIDTDCASSFQALLEETQGDSGTFGEFDSPITIINQDIDSVTFEVHQVFSEAGVGMLAVSYREATEGSLMCDMESGNVLSGTTNTYTAECISGYAEVNVYVFTGDVASYDEAECEACQLTNPDTEVAFRYVVPCTPVCKPPVPDCLTGPLVTLADIADEDVCIYADMPVMVDENSMDDVSVAFQIDNQWPNNKVTSVSVSYVDATTGEATCGTYPMNDDGFKITETINASCDGGLTTIVVNVHSEDITYDANQIENTCTNPTDGGTCSYEIVLPCEPGKVCAEGTPDPSSDPSSSPTTESPTSFPTKVPSAMPSNDPSETPTANPTANPTSDPTTSPSESPTAKPTSSPTTSPSSGPTATPTASPSGSPTTSPTASPTTSPSVGPTATPTTSPSAGPSGSFYPSSFPSEAPTKSAEPSSSPTGTPTSSPTDSPTTSPSESPTTSPSATPTAYPTESMNPTDCTESMGTPLITGVCYKAGAMMDIPTPLLDDAVIIMGENGDSVDFTVVTNMFAGAHSIYVNVVGDNEETSCDLNEGDQTYNAKCSYGYTTATVVVHYEDQAIEACDACSVGDLTVDYCAYSLQIPCEAAMPVECGEPSSAPSSSPTNVPTTSPTFNPTASPTSSPTAVPTTSPSSGPTATPTTSPSASPSSGPTATPTTSPSASPSAGPTASPTTSPTTSPSAGPTSSPTTSPTTSPTATPTAYPTESMSPTDCTGMEEPAVQAVCYEGGTQSATTMDLPTDAITITGSGASVSVAIKDGWEDAVIAIAVKHLNDAFETSCDVYEDVTVEMNAEAYCIEGLTTVVVIAYLGDEFALDECDACAVDDVSDMSGTFCAYSIEIPCDEKSVDCGEPSASPSGSFYPSQAPSESPTKSASPSASPTTSPSAGPTATPTTSPSSGPTASPTSSPTTSPSAGPTSSPTTSPTTSPSAGPTASPTSSPTTSPSASPSAGPTVTPTTSPSSGPTSSPTTSPTTSPSAGPTSSPTTSPTTSPSAGPTSSPTTSPTTSPSAGPTASPTTSPSASPSATPTAYPTESMSPTDCTGMDEPDVQAVCYEGGTVSADTMDLPTDAITITGSGASVSVAIKDGWEDAVIAIAVKHMNDAFENICDVYDVEVEINAEAYCIEGVTTVVVIAYRGDQFALDDCDACDVDDVSDMSGTFCAYSIEIPCDEKSVDCGEPSASPSGSFYPSQAPSESPTKSASPSASPTTSPSAGPTATPTTSPSSGPTASPTSSPTTSPSAGPTSSPTTSPTTSPSAGPTASPTSSPTTSPSASPSAGPTATPTTSPSSGPTASPTSSPTTSPSAGPTATPTTSPSSGPTASPTSSPTTSPSAGPTATPTSSPTNYPTESMNPTGCYDPMEPDVINMVCKQAGGDAMDKIEMPAGALTIGELLDGRIGVTVNQYWTTDDATVDFAIKSGLESCVINEDVTFGTSEEFMATCTEGYAALTVVVYFDDDFVADDCDACNVADIEDLGGSYEFCAYSVEIPCEASEVPCGEPSASPSGSFYPSEAPSEAPTKSASPSSAPTGTPTAGPTSSPSSSPTTSPTSSPSASPSASPTTASPSAAPTDSCPERVAELVSNEGDTMYDEIPVKITMQNDTHVGFQVLNTFGKPVSSFFTQYHAGDFGETECDQEENVEVDAPIEYVAKCMTHTKISVMNLWVQDCTEEEENAFLALLDDAEVPECCHPGDVCKTVQYTFKIPCVDPCPPDEIVDESVRRLEAKSAEESIREKKADEESTQQFEELTGHADPDGTEDHFCVVEDYPCGASLDKVHVCHYSARDGYKTFCVPEADSDALRFYPKDYCGPCVGGYSTA